MNSGLDLNKLLQQAQEFQKKLQEKQEAGENIFHPISVGGGMVELEISEGMKIKNIKIAKELLDPKEAEALEELLQIAFNEAINKVKKASSPDMGDMMSSVQNLFGGSK